MDITIGSDPGTAEGSGGCVGGTCTCGHGEGSTPLLDVRAIPAAVRHAAVHGALGAVPVDGAIRLAAPHDPVPLLTELETQRPGAFAVSYVERGPDTWVLELTRQR
jgi:uncharacterized protein (DUF2249 family)